MKIPKRILILILIVALLEPLGVYQIAIIHNIFAVGKFCAMLTAAYLLISRNCKFDLFLIAVLVYLLGLAVSTINNDGELRAWFTIFYTFMSICVLTKYLLSLNYEKAIRGLASVFTAILFVNLLTLFIIGIDSSAEGEYGGSGLMYLIGIRTRIGDWAFVAFPLAIIAWGKKKISVKLILCVVSALVFMLLNRVSASILCTVLYFILVFWPKSWRYMKKAVFISYFGALVVTVLIVAFEVQKYFSWLIVDILGESLSLNSRTYIWNEVLFQLKEHWLLGFGAGAEKYFVYAQDLWVTRATSAAHNQFLGLLYDGGIVGLVTFSLIILIALRGLNRSMDSLAVKSLGASFIVYFILMIPEISAGHAGFFVLLTIIAYSNAIDQRKPQSLSSELSFKNTVPALIAKQGK